MSSNGKELLGERYERGLLSFYRVRDAKRTVLALSGQHLSSLNRRPSYSFTSTRSCSAGAV